MSRRELNDAIDDFNADWRAEIATTRDDGWGYDEAPTRADLADPSPLGDRPWCGPCAVRHGARDPWCAA